MRLVARPNRNSPLRDAMMPVAAVAASLLICAVFILLAGANPLTAFGIMAKAAFWGKFALTETLARAAPLILSGLAALVALTLHYTAYLSEVYRAGIQSVPKGQTQAASALGMSRGQTFIRIVLPQAVRTVTPALGNYFISLFKDTALASVVTVQELLFSGQIIAARTYQYFTIYTVCMIMYFSVGYPAALFVRWLEKRTSGGYARRRRRQKGGQA